MEVAENLPPKRVSFKLAIGFSIISAVLVFIAFFGRDHGLSNITKVVRYPEVFQSYIFQAIGGSLGLPAINVLLASAFKSKRNSCTRRRIFIGWALVIIVIETIAIVSL